MNYNPFSPSRLQTYKQCPKRFFNQYIAKLKGTSQVDTSALRFGEMLHSMIELTCLGFRFDLGQMYREKFGGSEKPEYSIEATQSYLKKALDFYNKKKEELKDFKPLLEYKFGINQHFKPTSFDDENALFRGKIDLCFISENEIHIYDWKTGKNSSPLDQLRFYAMMLNHVYQGREIFYLANYYLQKEAPKRINKMTAIELDEFESKTMSNITDLQLVDDWPMNRTPLCNWCNYNNECQTEMGEIEIAQVDNVGLGDMLGV